MKTTTLVDKNESPTCITCPGHVSLKTFNKALANEWEGDPYDKKHWKENRRFEYMIPHKTKQWKYVDPGTKGAKKVTVLIWD